MKAAGKDPVLLVPPQLALCWRVMQGCLRRGCMCCRKRSAGRAGVEDYGGVELMGELYKVSDCPLAPLVRGLG